MRYTLLILLMLIVLRSSASITFSIQPEHCSHADGRVVTSVTGGVPPYSYSWSNGATTANLNNVPAGSYTLTVTDDLGDIQENTAVVPNMPNWEWDPDLFFAQAIPPCIDGTGGFVFFGSDFDNPLQGPGPHDMDPYCDQGWPFSSLPSDWGWVYAEILCPWTQPGTTYTVNYTDATGCPGTMSAVVPQSPQFNAVTIELIEGSCSGAANGRVIFHMEPEPQYIYGLKPHLFDPDGQPNSNFVNTLASNWTNGWTYDVPDLGPGTYSIVRGITIDPLHENLYPCGDITTFTIPDLGACGVISGRAFVDDNQNCLWNGGEANVQASVIEVLPGPYYTTTSAQGSYSLVLPYGSYTVEQQSTVFQEHCTGGPIPFELSLGAPTAVQDLPDTSLVDMDAQVSITSGLARPGFTFTYATVVRNLTPTGTGATTVSFTFDPTISLISAVPAPTNISGNTITWDQTQLGGWQERSYSLQFQVPPDVGLLGYELVANVTLTTVNTDGDLSNNAATNWRTITGAYDPNDKLAYTSNGNISHWHIGNDEWIDYTIRFQNTGTDTAFNVLITDTLPANLDPGTIVWGAASHAHTRILEGQGVLKFQFPNILLPDSNVNEPLSHGFVGFRIRPRLPLLPGDEIENIANIYFDFNPPVITEPSVLVASTSTGIAQAQYATLTVLPNPTDGQLVVRRSGKDFRPGVLRIRSTDGRVVMELRMPGTEMRMDVGGLASGAYVMELLNDNGPHPVVRFVKQ